MRQRFLSSHPFPKAPGLREAFKPRRWWLAGATALLLLAAPALRPASAPADRYFRVTAFSYEYAPAVLTVNPRDRVTIDVVASDVAHGLYVDGYDLSVTAEPGQTARLTFTADRPGTFRLRCSVNCGPLHPFMSGKLIVGTNWLYWQALALAALVVGLVVLGRPARGEPGEASPASPA